MRINIYIFDGQFNTTIFVVVLSDKTNFMFSDIKFVMSSQFFFF